MKIRRDASQQAEPVSHLRFFPGKVLSSDQTTSGNIQIATESEGRLICAHFWLLIIITSRTSEPRTQASCL